MLVGSYSGSYHVTQVEFMNTIYNVVAPNNVFKVDATEITLSEGLYDGVDFEALLNQELAGVGGSVVIDYKTLKLQFSFAVSRKLTAANAIVAELLGLDVLTYEGTEINSVRPINLSVYSDVYLTIGQNRLRVFGVGSFGSNVRATVNKDIYLLPSTNVHVNLVSRGVNFPVTNLRVDFAGI